MDRVEKYGRWHYEFDRSGGVERVEFTSPGGTTEAALEVFKEGKISELISAAINRAYERSKELSK